ncbi:MAG: hypothetical protein AAGF23_17935 [Acidobacteriota bacterium]
MTAPRIPRRAAVAALVAGLATLPAAATDAAGPGVPAESPPVQLLPERCEMELALSAAPAHLRKDAAVYGLELDGYRLLREGTNGFTCLVNRDHPKVIKPTCFDREGGDTVVPKILAFGEALMAGTPLDAIRTQVDEGFRRGDFRSPGPGVAYMLSRYNRPYDPATDTLGWFPPHLMFYAPDLEGADIGFQMEAWHEDNSLPFIGYQGPHGYMIVITHDGADRSPDDLPACPSWVREG